MWFDVVEVVVVEFKLLVGLMFLIYGIVLILFGVLLVVVVVLGVMIWFVYCDDFGECIYLIWVMLIVVEWMVVLINMNVDNIDVSL